MTMYIITKTFTFSASHRLSHLPETHQCFRLHGHNYSVTVELRADLLDPDDFVIDYGRLDPIKDWIKEQFDHRHINDFMTRPTAENIAKFIYQRWVGSFPIYSVEVKETEVTSAKYTGEK